MAGPGEWLDNDATDSSSNVNSPPPKRIEIPNYNNYVTLKDGRMEITQDNGYYRINITSSNKERNLYDSVSFGDPKSPQYIEGFSGIEDFVICTEGLTITELENILSRERRVDIRGKDNTYQTIDQVLLTLDNQEFDNETQPGLDVGGELAFTVLGDIVSLKILNHNEVVLAATQITFNHEEALTEPGLQDFSTYGNIDNLLEELKDKSLTDIIVFFMPKAIQEA